MDDVSQYRVTRTVKTLPPEDRWSATLALLCGNQPAVVAALQQFQRPVNGPLVELKAVMRESAAGRAEAARVRAIKRNAYRAAKRAKAAEMREAA